MIAAAALVAALILGRTSYRFTFGQGIPIFVDPGATLDDLERVAEGQDAGSESVAMNPLARAVLAAAIDPWQVDRPGRWAIAIGFGPATASIVEADRFGWPTPWIERYRHPNYEDALRRRGFLPSRTDPDARPLGTVWEMPRDPLRIPPLPRVVAAGGALWSFPPPEQTGGVRTIIVYRPGALATLGGTAILAWCVWGWAARILRRIRGLPRRPPSRRLRRAFVVAAVLGLVGAAAATARTTTYPPRAEWASRTQANYPPQPVYWTYAGMARTALMRDQVEQMAREPDGDRLLAQEILRAARAAGVDRAGYLAVLAECETICDTATATQFSGAVPVLRVSSITHIRRPDFGVPQRIATRRGIRWHLSSDGIGLSVSTGEADRPTSEVLISPELAGAAIVGLWGVGLALRDLGRAAATLLAARRRRRGRCAACGYRLGAIVP